jgi:hypothetical protein
MAGSPEREIDGLYGLPPEEFTPARDRLAKDLKAAGNQEGSATVKELRRPTVAAWAVNQLVRREAKAADALLEAGDELRKAQRRILSGVSGSAGLREAADRRRKAVRALVKAAEAILGEAGRSSAATIEAVQATLEAASTDEQAGRLFKEGRLPKEFPPPAGFGSVEALALVPSLRPKAVPKAPRATEARGRRGDRTGGDVAKVAELRAERDEARKAARGLDQAAANARKEATRTSRAAVKAEEEAERARRSAEEARRRARDLATAAREAGSEASRAEREADRAKRALEQAEERLSAGRR